jgi:hypothetical protein
LALLDTMRPVVDGTIERLTAANFCCDPLMGEEYSRITSVVSSAYKRHGQILETAILECLRSYDRFEVWNDPALPISRAAEGLAAPLMANPAAALEAHIPHGGDADRALQIDLLVHDRELNTLASYEVKRGAGSHDAGKRRSMMRDLICTQVILKSYGEARLGLPLQSASSHIIVYYGAENFGPFTLTRDTLDDHFGVPIIEQVEEVNEYYRGRVETLLQAGPADPQLF